MEDKNETKKQLFDKISRLRKKISELQKAETERKKMQQAAQEAREFAESIVDTIREPLVVLDGKLKVISANRSFYQTFQVTEEETVGNYLYDLGNRQWDIPKLKELLEEILPKSTSFSDFEVEHAFPYIGTRTMLLNARRLYRQASKAQMILLAIEDITERKQAEKKLEHLNLVLRAIRSVNQLITREKDRDRLLKIACKLLIESRGYHNAWIALLDGSGKLVTASEAGLSKDFFKMVHFLRRGELPNCGKRALSQSGVVVTTDPPSACADCPLVSKYAGRGGITIRLGHRKKVYGLLSASIPADLVDDQEELTLFSEVAADLALALYNIELEEERKRAEEALRQSHAQLQKTLEGTIHALASTAELRDPYTAGHQRRVTQLACTIAEEMDLPQEQIEGLHMAALIHDIGKISVPAEILSKPARLTELEFAMIKTHPQAGYDILKGIEFPWPVAQIVLQHHERMDGSGYPHGLSGKDILLEARILGVADVVEAMSSHRPYRPAHSLEAALEEISKKKGVFYDPEVVDACLRLFTNKGFKFD